MPSSSPVTTYKLRPEPPADVRAALAPYSDTITGLLYHRGVSEADAARAFLSPQYDIHTHDPFLLADMEKAARRIIAALQAGEHIVIFGDYDADGVPATVLLQDFLTKAIAASSSASVIDIYIPHRHTEGFGLNEKAVRWAASIGATLLVTVDCGIVDAEEVDLANSLGVAVIITDHHEPHGVLPAAYAVVDPKRHDCTYPEKILCGSGVAFKLVQAIVSIERFNLPVGWEKWLLDLVAIATLSDMVPLVGENRVLTTYGMIVLRKTRRVGLAALLAVAGVNPKYMTEEDVTFSISPRINAASRMADPRDAFALLATHDAVEAKTRAKDLEKLNKSRKVIVAQITKQARRVIEERYGDAIPDVLAFGDPSWMPSLLGLVCSSLVREFGRPVFLWGREGGEDIKGSCRSDGGMSVVEIMKEVRGGILETFGGHVQAGGFVVDQHGVHSFEEAFIEAVGVLAQKSISENEVGCERGLCWIDRKIIPTDVTPAFIREVHSLAPFGVGNEHPLFLIDGARIDEVRWFGAGAIHLELRVSSPLIRAQSGSGFVEAICFFARENNFSIQFVQGDVLDIVGTVEMNTFMGAHRPRIRIKDVARHGTLLKE